MTDALRATNSEEAYTFWDFQAGAWRKNNGIRIDTCCVRRKPLIGSKVLKCIKICAAAKNRQTMYLWLGISVSKSRS